MARHTLVEMDGRDPAAVPESSGTSVLQVPRKEEMDAYIDELLGPGGGAAPAPSALPAPRAAPAPSVTLALPAPLATPMLPAPTARPEPFAPRIIAGPLLTPPDAREIFELMSSQRGEDFSLNGERYFAKVVDVYDGDTIRVTFRFRGALTQFKARMAGYDSPELRPPKSRPGREREVAAGQAARDALRTRVDNRLVLIECGSFDKYGRLLVTVAENGECINAWMVAQGHGVPYDGGRKTPFAADACEDARERAGVERTD